MLVLASIIIQLPWVHVLGATYLLYLGIAHFGRRHRHGQEREYDAPLPPRRGGFWMVVLSIELADLAFSIDNVVAAVALSSDLRVVLVGIAIGILAMRFAATLFTKMIAWEPELESGAYLLLLFIGARFLLERWLDLHMDEYAQFGISLGILALTIAFARVHALRSLLIIFRPVPALFVVIQSPVSLIARVLAAPICPRPPST